MEILKLLDKNVMEKTDRNEFFSTIFTRKKRDGINFEFATFKHIITIRSALLLVKQDCLIASADLKDAEYPVSIFSTDRNFFKNSSGKSMILKHMTT